MARTAKSQTVVRAPSGSKAKQLATTEDNLNSTGSGKAQAKRTLVSFAQEPRWVAWLQEKRNGDLTKVPKNPATGRNAQVPTEPSTWGTRLAATECWESIKKQNPKAVGGDGIVLRGSPKGAQLAGIDLDSCRDPETGKIAAWAWEVIERFNTYAEVSPSGTGVKLFSMMTAEEFAKLDTLLGLNKKGEQLTRKTFAAGKHREVAIDTARFYAVTDERLEGYSKLRWVPFEDVEWFVKVAGPKYLATQKSGNGHGFAETVTSINATHAGVKQRDESRSGDAYRFMQDQHAERVSYEQMREKILADEGPIGEWANTKGLANNERELERTWENSAPKQKPAPPVPKTLFLEELQQRPLVPVEWIVLDYVLAGTVNGLFGDGGVGKDLLLFQLAIAMTCGAQWLGRDVRQGRVIYCMVEDSLDELRRREDKITTFLATHGQWRPRTGELKIVSLVGEDSVLAAFDQKEGVVKSRPLYTALCEMVEKFKPDLVIVPNRVNSFSVEQMSDAHARQCIALLVGICERSGTAVIMPGHVSLEQLSSGGGSSGSVQWSNALRLRSFLRKPKPEKGEKKEDIDPNLRELEVMKANWSPTGNLEYLNWEDGLFKPIAHQAFNPSPVLDTETELKDEQEVLRLFGDLLPGDEVSPMETTNKSAVKRFSEKGIFKRLGKNTARERVRDAIARLYEKEVLYTIKEGSPSKPSHRIAKVSRP